MQQTVETALATVLRLPEVALTVAGRTDAGVHASGQVAHADLPASAWSERGDSLVARLRCVLPADVRVTAVRAVPPEFDARFAALWRRYEYRVTDAPWGADPLQRGTVLAWPRSLDADAMSAAAQRLLGLHDFAGFCRRREGATTVRRLDRLTVGRDGHVIRFEVLADAFCHSMVRSLVGCLLAIGEGRKDVTWAAASLRRVSRSSDIHIASARGLTLEEVGYPADDELAGRLLVTRARRSREEL